MQRKLSRNIYCMLCVITFGFYLWMAIQIPYTHDDWDWGLSSGLNYLLTGSINSRYSGNFFAVIMTRSEILRNFIMACCYFFLPFGLTHYAMKGQKNSNYWNYTAVFLLSNILFLSIRRDIWQQTYGWVSGFANFVISSVFLLIWIYEIKYAWSITSPTQSNSLLWLALYFIISIMGQMFIENLSIYITMLALFLCGVYAIRFHKVPIKNIIMLLGSLIGLIFIFSSKIYDSLWSTGETVSGYRSLVIGEQYSLPTCIYILLVQATLLAPHIFEHNIIQCLVILFLISFHIILSTRKNTLLKTCMITANLLLAIYCVYSYISTETLSFLGKFTPLLFNFFFFVTIAVEAIFLFHEKKYVMSELLTVWISAPAVIIPLVVTTETGYRLFFTSNVFLILFSLLLFVNLLPLIKWDSHHIAVVLAIVMCTLLCFYGKIYLEIGNCKRERDKIISEFNQTNSSAVILPSFPHTEYLWAADPIGTTREQHFRDFYGLPQNIKIVIQQ